MLYLTRKIGESVIINNNIELTVIEVRGKSAKLGFTFPTDASVLRKELFERIREENIAAAGADASALDDAAVSTLDRATEGTARHQGSDPDE